MLQMKEKHWYLFDREIQLLNGSELYVGKALSVQRVWLKAVLLVSKLNKRFVGYFDPEKIFFR